MYQSTGLDSSIHRTHRDLDTSNDLETSLNEKMEDKRRGPQGVQGVQGIEGIQGQGAQGIPGTPGAKGDTGKTGSMFPHSVTRSFLVMGIVFTLVVAAMGYQQYVIGEQQAQLDDQQQGLADLVVANRKIIKTTNDALCNIRADLADRVQAAEDYLADVEAGRRQAIQGITEADINRTLAGQKTTLKGLRPLICPTPPG